MTTLTKKMISVCDCDLPQIMIYLQFMVTPNAYGSVAVMFAMEFIQMFNKYTAKVLRMYSKSLWTLMQMLAIY